MVGSKPYRISEFARFGEPVELKWLGRLINKNGDWMVQAAVQPLDRDERHNMLLPFGLMPALVPGRIYVDGMLASGVNHGLPGEAIIPDTRDCDVVRLCDLPGSLFPSGQPDVVLAVKRQRRHKACRQLRPALGCARAADVQKVVRQCSMRAKRPRTPPPTDPSDLSTVVNGQNALAGGLGGCCPAVRLNDVQTLLQTCRAVLQHFSTPGANFIPLYFFHQ